MADENDHREEEFICEPMTPAAGTGDAQAMARGLPGLPSRFVWRETEYEVAEVLATWKTSGRERGGTEIYLRRHWFQIRTTSGHVMSVYCDRQARDRKNPKRRWWVYTVERK